MMKKSSPETESLDVNEVIAEVVRLLRSDALIKGVTIKLDLSGDLSKVAANRPQLQQVLLNLITNGFAVMQGVPEEQRTLTLSTAGDDTTVRVSVRDEGTGFTGTDISELFKPFRTTKSEGLGMGLAITGSIVEVHGGKIWGENNPDRGASVHFSLPVETSG